MLDLDVAHLLVMQTMIAEPLVQSSTTNGKAKNSRSRKMRRAAALAEEAEEPGPSAALASDTLMDVEGSFMNTEPTATENDSEARIRGGTTGFWNKLEDELDCIYKRLGRRYVLAKSQVASADGLGFVEQTVKTLRPPWSECVQHLLSLVYDSDQTLP